MRDVAPPHKPTDAATPHVDEATRNAGTPPAGSHLKQKQERNTELTEKSQQNPTGGAHSATPDSMKP